MSNCLDFLVASFPGIIVICGLVALLCIVLFDNTPAHGRTVKKFREPGKIKYDIHNVIVDPNTAKEDIEFDTDDLLVKVEKEISPDSTVCLEIFPNKEFVPGSNVWQVQVTTDTQEDRRSEEQSYVFTFRYLQNVLWIFLGIVPGTSQKTGAVRSSTISKNRKYK